VSGNKNKFVTAVIFLLIVFFALLIFLKINPEGKALFDRLLGKLPPAVRPPSENPAGRNAASSRNATTVRITPVTPGTIEKSVIINGEILARNQVTIFPTAGGRLVESYRGVGDRVNRGDVVAMVDSSRPGERYLRSSVVSTVSGTVLQASYSIGDTVTTQSPVFVVGDLSSLFIETNIAERFVASIALGMRAVLLFEAVPDEIFFAEVTEINPVLDPASRTLRIRLRFLNPDLRIKAGMFATISLVTNRKVNIPVIPRLSVISTYGSWIVFIVDENNIARRREITLGIDNEEFIEVLDGLSIGEKVVSTGQNFLSDGDLVRIVE
jgi:multidrug efflux pump subunit AcrA (membrane-fusion protein)